MSDLLLPDGLRPTNLHLLPGTKVRYVSNDVFNIAGRLREISPRLYILELERNSSEGSMFGYSIMEQCHDGVDRLVFRVSKGQLTQRHVLDRIGYLMSKDLHTRIAILDAEREKWESESHEDEMEKLYDQMGGPMWTELEKTGFIQRPVSYPKTNATARRHRRHIGEPRQKELVLR
jgi:hypothetical protein